jgi:putative MATE family efflux protein
LKGGHREYTSGSIPRAIALLSIPMVLEMVLESLFAVVDIFFVAKLGDNAVATVGVTESMLALVYGVVMGISAAATATVARRIGEKDKEGANRAAAQTVILSLIAAAAMGIPMCLGAEWLLGQMSNSPEVARYGTNFTRIMFGGMAGIVLLFTNNAILRGAGDAVYAMRALWLANIINLTLDPILIFGFGPIPAFGVTGAAIATTTGRTVGALYGLWLLFNGRGEIHIEARHWKWDTGLIRQMLSIAGPATFQYLVPTASWVGLMRIVSLSGPTAVAAYTIAIRIIIFTILPAWGLSNAAATLVGQNLGAKEPDRAQRSVMLCGLYNMGFLVGVSLAFIILADPLIAFFTTDPAVAPLAADCLRILGYGYAFYAWGMVLVQAFNGAGDTRTPTVINFACYWMFQIPLAYFLAQSWNLGPRGAFWAVPIAESALAVLAFVVFQRGRWKEVKV